MTPLTPIIARYEKELVDLQRNRERIRDAIRRAEDYNPRLEKLLADEQARAAVVRGVLSELRKLQKQEREALRLRMRRARHEPVLHATRVWNYRDSYKVAVEKVIDFLRENKQEWVRRRQILEAVKIPVHVWAHIRAHVKVRVEHMGSHFRYKD